MLPAGTLTTATTGAVAFGASLVNRDLSAIDVFSVRRGDGTVRFCVVGHFDEAESSGPARFTVRDDTHAGDSSVRLKERPEAIVRRSITEVPNEYFLHVLPIWI
jgi:hypothetical protein